MKGMAWRIQWNRSVESDPFPKPTCLRKTAPQELLQGQDDSKKWPLLCKSEGPTPWGKGWKNLLLGIFEEVGLPFLRVVFTWQAAALNRPDACAWGGHNRT